MDRTLHKPSGAGRGLFIAGIFSFCLYILQGLQGTLSITKSLPSPQLPLKLCREEKCIDFAIGAGFNGY